MFKRIFTGYLLVLLISFAVLALAFSFTVRQYLINDTVNSLYRVAETLSASAIQEESQGPGRMRGTFFNLANRIAYAEYILLEADGTIIESSDLSSYPPGAEMLNEKFRELALKDQSSESLVERNRVAVAFPVILGEGRREASLILYSELDMLTQLNRSLLAILGFAGGVGIITSLLAGIFATRYAVGPLQQLKERASELANRKFEGKLDINTGDELEELADTFNDMAGQLAEYDHTQKDFFQKTSHELKTPLMSIQGYAEALKDGVIPEEERGDSLEIIIKQSRRMKALVDEFIYLSKMESLKESYSFETIILDDAINEAVHAVKSMALEKEINIVTTIEATDLKIEGDPEKIHRLLLNILSNALHHARKKVAVTVKEETIQIEDDGPGFDPDQLEKAFNPFFYRTKNGGSGLGLAISRAIMEKHGGTITVKNKPSESGAQVTIKFTEPKPQG